MHHAWAPEMSDLKCPECGKASVGTYVQHGSFFSRCESCGASGPVTSWIGIAPNLHGRISAVLVGQPQTGTVVAEGEAEEVAERIGNAAQHGALVQLFIEYRDA